MSLDIIDERCTLTQEKEILSRFICLLHIAAQIIPFIGLAEFILYFGEGKIRGESDACQTVNMISRT